MPIENSNQVDVVAEGDEGYELVIAMNEGEWAHPQIAQLLQKKFNSYASFALDGQMQRLYPESKGKRVFIVISHADPIPPDIAKFIDQIAAILAKDGLTVTVEPLPAAEAA